MPFDGISINLVVPRTFSLVSSLTSFPSPCSYLNFAPFQVHQPFCFDLNVPGKFMPQCLDTLGFPLPAMLFAGHESVSCWMLFSHWNPPQLPTWNYNTRSLPHTLYLLYFSYWHLLSPNIQNNVHVYCPFPTPLECLPKLIWTPSLE